MIAYGHWLATQSLAICSSDSHPLQHASAFSSASLISNQSTSAGWNLGVWLNFGGRGGGLNFPLIRSYVWCCCRHSQNNSLLPSLRKCLCMYVCEASPRYESQISICQNRPPFNGMGGKKKIPPSTVLIIYSAVGDQTRVSSHRQPIMRFFTQAGSKPTMAFRLSLGKHSRARKTCCDSHCV